ncbi:MAG: isoprenylcysteine carboxylmethyltransferase family protein [Anaerolineales bacterium]
MLGAILIFCSTLVYGAVHSLLASLCAKAVARKMFAPSADRWYRLGFNFAAGITLLPVLGLLAANVGPVLVAVPWPGWAILVAMELAALLLMAYVFRHSDPAFFMGFGQLGNEPSTGGLATTGAYGIVRHPLYSTGLLMLWCFPILTTGTLAFDAAITVYILIGSELEERRLIVQFGEEYLRYRKKVARLIPFLF